MALNIIVPVNTGETAIKISITGVYEEQDLNLPEFLEKFSAQADSLADPKEESAHNCLTCAYEPKWALIIPTERKLCGHCRARYWGTCPIITREGQTVTYDDQPVTDCPGWEQKKD